ncbi:UNVERIFIED_CONTAM: universal stress family protein [Hammondia hammondi]|eukprot:XP_008886820.1 universal stress family protein [Hammondia hammondi]
MYPGPAPASIVPIDGFASSSLCNGSWPSPCPLCASPVLSYSPRPLASRSPARSLLTPRVVPADFLLPPASARAQNGALQEGSASGDSGRRDRRCACGPYAQGVRSREGSYAKSEWGWGESSQSAAPNHCAFCGGIQSTVLQRRFSSFFQESLTCTSGQNVELLIWGVRKLIESDFPCLYNRNGIEPRGTEEELLDRSSSDSEKCCTSQVCRPGDDELPSTSEQTPTHELKSPASAPCVGSPVSAGFVIPFGRALSSPGLGDCWCGGGANAGGVSCEERQIVVVSVEGHRQRDRTVLKWIRNNVLKSGDVVVLVTAWERAEDPKYLKVPGMILNSFVDASSYNIGMVSKLSGRLKHLAAALLSDCRVYPLIVPLSRVNKTSVGNLLCQCASDLQADALVVGSHGHTSLRQVLCGSVSRHVRSHATCKVVLPRV